MIGIQQRAQFSLERKARSFMVHTAREKPGSFRNQGQRKFPLPAKSIQESRAVITRIGSGLVKMGKPAGSNLNYGGPLTELALLGVIACTLEGETLEWDAENMRFTNNEKSESVSPKPPIVMAGPSKGAWAFRPQYNQLHTI